MLEAAKRWKQRRNNGNGMAVTAINVPIIYACAL